MEKDQVAIHFFTEILGPTRVLSYSPQNSHFGLDWTKAYQPQFRCVLLPGTSQEIAQCLAYCFENNLTVVPSGGRTGMAGGAVARQGEVVISLMRMNKILEVDRQSMAIVVEAGAINQEVAKAAAQNGLALGLDLASKGSCQIGGNIATNAGGLKFIRYGGMREQVLGLEVVLANGKIIEFGSKLRKNNSGYDLKHLFIGSEGTLGIITKATLKLVPEPCEHALALIAADSFANILQVVEHIQTSRLVKTGIEYFSQNALNKVLMHFKEMRQPFTELWPHYLLLEVERENKDDNPLLLPLEKAANNGWLQDAIIAQNPSEFAKLWAYRERISESIQTHFLVYKNDLSLAPNSLEAFLKFVENVAKDDPNLEIVPFGHVGDGNIHLNYLNVGNLTKELFFSHATAMEKKIFRYLKELRGSISAEHGIGLSKKEAFASFVNPEELLLMQAIKKTLDPKGILNPGKIFGQS